MIIVIRVDNIQRKKHAISVLKFRSTGKAKLFLLLGGL